MSGSAWAALAAAANSVGGSLQKNAEEERQLKLKQIELDAQQKRDVFLARMRQQFDDESAEKKHDRESEDVTDSFNDPETGNVYGRTKGGKTVVLNETSTDYQSQLADAKKNKAALEEAQLKNAQLQPELTRAQADAANARAFRSRNPAKRETKDPMPDKIRSEYMRIYNQVAKSDDPDLKDEKTGKIDPLKVDAQTKIQLYPVFGGENVNASLGGNARPAQATAPPRPAPQQQSPTQPNAPSVEVLMQQANAAVKAGADPAKVEARLKEAMAKFGYVQ